MLKLLYPGRGVGLRKQATFYNKKKQIIKTEEYTDEQLQLVNEWKYDDKNRVISHVEDNKLTGKTYRKSSEYTTDKKSGELVVSECSYFNGRIEFYTKSYFDRNNVKYKEVRLNDNNKDVIHIESYVYGENGKVKDRSVFFPEFKVTKKFTEVDGLQLPKCIRTFTMGIVDKPLLNTRISYIKKVIGKNKLVLMDKDCGSYEYKFTNSINCEIVVLTTKINNGKQIVFRFKEKLQ